MFAVCERHRRTTEAYSYSFTSTFPIMTIICTGYWHISIFATEGDAKQIISLAPATALLTHQLQLPAASRIDNPTAQLQARHHVLNLASTEMIQRASYIQLIVWTYLSLIRSILAPDALVNRQSLIDRLLSERIVSYPRAASAKSSRSSQNVNEQQKNSEQALGLCIYVYLFDCLVQSASSKSSLDPMSTKILLCLLFTLAVGSLQGCLAPCRMCFLPAFPDFEVGSHPDNRKQCLSHVKRLSAGKATKSNTSHTDASSSPHAW